MPVLNKMLEDSHPLIYFREQEFCLASCFAPPSYGYTKVCLHRNANPHERETLPFLPGRWIYIHTHVVFKGVRCVVSSCLVLQPPAEQAVLTTQTTQATQADINKNFTFLRRGKDLAFAASSRPRPRLRLREGTPLVGLKVISRLDICGLREGEEGCRR